jgi:ParB-like chromosome segregation protein Spo0J
MEMKLLYTSIKHDGFTQPVVTVRDDANDCWVVVDGFHRYSIMKRYRDIYELNHGLLPIVVIDKPINDRMASTIRHNRARGRHSLDGMSALVVQLLNNGWGDRRICDELGLEKEELIRLKHLTGYAKFFLNSTYSPAMETSRQIEERLKFEGQEGDVLD